MITGPARFPVARNEKRVRWADAKRERMLELQRKAKASIIKKLRALRPAEALEKESLKGVEKHMVNCLATIRAIDTGRDTISSRPLFVSSITNYITRLHSNRKYAEVSHALQILRDYEKGNSKPAVTKRHSIWELEEKRLPEAPTGKKLQLEREGLKIVSNYDINRLQLFFDEKPSDEMRAQLKKSGWRWSPRESAWQRQITNAAVCSARALFL